MNLKQLAKKVDLLDGEITVWYMPFSNLRSQMIVDNIIEAFPDTETWPHWLRQFTFFEAYAIDAKLKTNSKNAHVRGLQMYMDKRNGSIAERADLFSYAVSRELQGVLFDAYTATREELPGVSPELAAGKPDNSDPEAVSDGGKR